MLLRSRIELIFISCFLLPALASRAGAEWPPEGVAICSAPGTQQNPHIISDGTGGAIVVWEDYRSGNWDIYAQRIDGSGDVRWTADGVGVAVQAGSDRLGEIAPDGAGGVFIAWRSSSGVHAQRINSLGACVGPANGVVLTTDGAGPLCVSDGVGGAIAAWRRYHEKIIWPGPRIHYYCYLIITRISADLSMQWGEVVVADEMEFCFANLAPDGRGGVFIVYKGAFELYSNIVRIDRSGAAPWSPQRLGEVDEHDPGYFIREDDHGAAIVSWKKAGGRYAQRVTGDGGFSWGIPVGSLPESEFAPDGAGGAIFGSAFVQKVDSLGATLWAPGGVATGVNGGIATDGAGGAIVGSTSVQRVSAEGHLLYAPGGLATGATAGARLAPDGSHGVYLAWAAGGAVDDDMFVQRIPRGAVPVLEPVGDRRVDVGSELAIDLAAASGDPEDSLTYWTDAGSVLRSTFTFDGQTGLFRWSPVMSDAGEYRVSFGVRGKWSGDFETITIRVYYNGTLPPLLDPIAPVTGVEGYPIVIDAHAFDPDGDALAYAISDSRYAQSGSHFTWRTKKGDAGVYHPIITVTDGVLCDSAAVTVTVESYFSGPSVRDRMFGGDSYFAWRTNGVAWESDDDGSLRGAADGDWYAAIVSNRVFTSVRDSIVTRILRTSSTNYVLGFTFTAPDATDFHYTRISFGIYVHSSGTIRPSWDPNNTAFWNTTLPAGLYDVLVAIDRGTGALQLAVDAVGAIGDPLSDFSNPAWESVETRAVPPSCYVQINPYNTYGRVYDVWHVEAGSLPPDEGGTVLESFATFATAEWIKVQWLLDRCSSAARFYLYRSEGGAAFAEIPDPTVDRIDMLFSYVDATVAAGGAYRYRIDVEDEDGRKTLFETETVTAPAEATVLDGFSVAADDSSIVLRWTLLSCAEDARFIAHRKAEEGVYEELVDAAIMRGDLVFTLVDKGILTGTTYRYRIDVDDHDGRRTLFESQPVAFTGPPVPGYRFALGQNYPNPFNPGTIIPYTLPGRSRVVIDIFDVGGRLVRRLADGVRDAGPNSEAWDGLDASGAPAASGVYVCLLSAHGASVARKMVLLR